jgi:hypothetical protein
MKKILLLAILTVIFYACSKQKSISPINKISVSGKWHLDVDTSTTYYNGGIESVVMIGDSYSYVNIYYQFNNDGSGLYEQVDKVTGAVTSQTFKYTVNANNQIVLNYPAQILNGAEQPAYSLTGVIETHSSNNLKIKFTTDIGSANYNIVDLDYLSLE